MSYRLGVDVGGTFTDLLLIDEDSGETYTAKVPSTPEDSSIGVLTGIDRICENNDIDPARISRVMHGTTVATNAVLTSRGARVGLVVTDGYHQVLQIARSFVPGGLGGWVTYLKRDPLAALQDTVEALERVGADGSVARALDEDDIRTKLKELRDSGIESLTVCLINSFTNPQHELRIKEIAGEIMPDIPVSVSYEVAPEMQEYERTETTVVNAYVRPTVARYLRSLARDIDQRTDGSHLSVLRSDGGLASTSTASATPVSLLLSGPAGGVAGANWFCQQAGFSDLLTFDMGGTSTDVCLIQNNEPKVRRETRVGDVTVRAPSLDVRTVGAGGGSIAFVPELTKALRVGPDSAGADPGPAAYDKGGEAPTVTDANVVLGFLPADAQLGGDMAIRKDLAEAAVQTIADAMGVSLLEAAEGIINIVNENMFGALRLVSVEQGYDPRAFALVSFGGAGPLHANALGILTGSWPVVVPPGPGVLCAYGDATTSVTDESARTFIRGFSDTDAREVTGILEDLTRDAQASLVDDGFDPAELDVSWQADVRYAGQGLLLTLPVTREGLLDGGLADLGKAFDQLHEQTFTFHLEVGHELVNLRSVVRSKRRDVPVRTARSSGSREDARIREHRIYHDGEWHAGHLYDRNRLSHGDVVPGPAVIVELDATTVVLPGHHANVDEIGNLLITPREND